MATPIERISALEKKIRFLESLIGSAGAIVSEKKVSGAVKAGAAKVVEVIDGTIDKAIDKAAEKAK